jgi:hypothetical protein
MKTDNNIVESGKAVDGLNISDKDFYNLYTDIAFFQSEMFRLFLDLKKPVYGLFRNRFLCEIKTDKKGDVVTTVARDYKLSNDAISKFAQVENGLVFGY